MRSPAAIRAAITEIEGDARYQAPPALIQVNAPLALIQVELKARRAALLWALEENR